MQRNIAEGSKEGTDYYSRKRHRKLATSSSASSVSCTNPVMHSVRPFLLFFCSRWHFHYHYFASVRRNLQRPPTSPRHHEWMDEALDRCTIDSLNSSLKSLLTIVTFSRNYCRHILTPRHSLLSTSNHPIPSAPMPALKSGETEARADDSARALKMCK